MLPQLKTHTGGDNEKENFNNGLTYCSICDGPLFADQEVAEKLSVSPGSPILFVERIMYTKRRKPVELVQSTYRGDLYKYIVRLKTVKGKKGSVWVHKEE